MAKSVLDIIIRTLKEGNADKETVKNLVALKGGFTEAVAAAGSLVAVGFAIQQVLSQTVGVLVEYADKVRSIQNATGITAEDSSKLIQVLDDEKISYEALSKAIAKSGKEFDFSIEGIARMSDQYLQLETAQERASFMQERFGKAWVDFVPVMQKGGESIMDAADNISGSLVLTQEAVDQTREYERALDEWGDAVEAAKVAAGVGLLPILTDLITVEKDAEKAFEAYAESIGMSGPELDAAGHGMRQFTAELERGRAMTKFYGEDLSDTTEVIEENADAAKEASAAHQSMIGLITSIANENQSYSEKQAELTLKMQENRAEAEKLYPWQKKQLEELNQKYVDMQGTYDANAQAHAAAMGKIQYDLLVTKLSVDGITTAEYNMIQQAGLMFGVFDQGSVNMAADFNSVSEAVAAGRLRVDEMTQAINMLPRYKNIDIVINTIQQMTGGWHAATSGAAAEQGIGGGFAAGGISTGPESGHMELLHGTEAVIPLQNGSVPVEMKMPMGAGGGGNTSINIALNINSPLTVLDKQTALNTIGPLIVESVRDARSRGAL